MYLTFFGEKMIVWKVVRRAMGRLVSAIADGRAMVEYKPGEWVEAPEWLRRLGYNLLAFDDLEAAKEFADKCWGSFEIWEAEAESVVYVPKAPLDLVSLACGEIEPDRHLLEWPEHTVMCRRLRLIRRVF